MPNDESVTQLRRIADALERIAAELDRQRAVESDRGKARTTPHPYVHVEGVLRCAACNLDPSDPVHAGA